LIFVLLFPMGHPGAVEHVVRFYPNALSDVEWAAVFEDEILPTEVLWFHEDHPDDEPSGYLLAQRVHDVKSARFDLDGDGCQELLVFLGVSGNSGSIGVPTSVYRRTESGWQKFGGLTLDGADDLFHDYPVMRLRDEDRAWFYREDPGPTAAELVRRYGVSRRFAGDWAAAIRSTDDGRNGAREARSLRRFLSAEQFAAVEAEVRRVVGEDEWARDLRAALEMDAQEAVRKRGAP
jgi:hypothetical protein